MIGALIYQTGADHDASIGQISCRRDIASYRHGTSRHIAAASCKLKMLDGYCMILALSMMSPQLSWRDILMPIGRLAAIADNGIIKRQQPVDISIRNNTLSPAMTIRHTAACAMPIAYRIDAYHVPDKYQLLNQRIAPPLLFLMTKCRNTRHRAASSNGMCIVEADVMPRNLHASNKHLRLLSARGIILVNVGMFHLSLQE